MTYAHKIDKAEAAIDWSDPGRAIARRVRAFNPAPGAHGGAGRRSGQGVGGAARVGADRAHGAAGEVLAVDSDGIHVQTGEGVLCLTELQRAGGKRLPVADFLRGFAVEPGQRFQLASAAEARGAERVLPARAP